MSPNLWIYSDRTEQSKTAAELIIFGAEIFKNSKMIKDLDKIKDKAKLNHPIDLNIQEFGFEYLIDCIRFLIFFENYMKAELLLREYCVHSIDSKYKGFEELAKIQNKRPIKLEEINKIEKFKIDKTIKSIEHPAILSKTVGIKVLIASQEYLSNYEFDNSLLKVILDFNTYRNKLHFQNTIEFQISNEFLSNLKSMNDFVDKIVNDRIKKNAP